jgi:hypothetical protein
LFSAPAEAGDAVQELWVVSRLMWKMLGRAPSG